MRREDAWSAIPQILQIMQNEAAKRKQSDAGDGGMFGEVECMPSAEEAREAYANADYEKFCFKCGAGFFGKGVTCGGHGTHDR